MLSLKLPGWWQVYFKVQVSWKGFSSGLRPCSHRALICVLHGGPCFAGVGLHRCPVVSPFRQFHCCLLGWSSCTDIAAAPKMTYVWVHSPKCSLGALGDPHSHQCLIGIQWLCTCNHFVPRDMYRTTHTEMHGTPVLAHAGKHGPGQGLSSPRVNEAYMFIEQIRLQRGHNSYIAQRMGPQCPVGRGRDSEFRLLY